MFYIFSFVTKMSFNHTLNVKFVFCCCFLFVLDKLGHCVDFEEAISYFCIFYCIPFCILLHVFFIKDTCEYIDITMQHIKLGLIG